MRSSLLFAIILIPSLMGYSPETSGQPKSANNIKNLENGKVWVPQTSVSLGKQFFLEKMNLKGNFLYKGIRFDNIEFAYDISTEKIILAIETEDKTKRNITVSPYFLEGFNVDDSTYKYEFLRGGIIHKELDSLKYYQVVKSQNLLYVIKRKKRTMSTPYQSKKFKYIDGNSLYLIKEGELISVRGKKDIINLFPNQKKEMKRFIRNNKLKISTETPMHAIPLLLKFDL